MHVPYPFFSKGLQDCNEEKAARIGHKHRLNNVNYANFLAHNRGARIIVCGALTSEWVISRKRARRIIMKQLDYINDFARKHSEDFAVAHSPREVRELLATTDKTILIHSIEGARKLIKNQDDAQFWVEQGVAFITLVHLVDYNFGGAAIKPGLIPALINLKGLLRKKSKRGLKDKGREAIRWLADAGIMIDLTHMSDQTRKDALDFMEQEKIPPLVTHDLFKPIQNHPRGITREDVLRIYQNNGFMALPVSGISLTPFHPEAYYQQKLDSLENYCEGSIDSYRFTYEAFKEFLESKAGEVMGKSSLNFEDLSEEQKVDFAIGFQSDFNGWLNHSRPRYGAKGCYPVLKDSSHATFELDGLAHPGLLGDQWEILEAEGVDLAPLKRSSEKFLQLWQHFLDNRKKPLGPAKTD